jgi:hypothetical protein
MGLTGTIANAHAAPGLDTKSLSNLIYQMNIVRRQVSAYPPGHHVILTAAQRTIKLLDGLDPDLSRITIGIARDRLMLGAVPLDPKNPVYREYARTLFSHGLVAMTIHRGLSATELSSFCQLLARNPHELLADGGIVRASGSAGVKNITVTPLDYSRFQTDGITETAGSGKALHSDNVPVWERFVSTLSLHSDGPLSPAPPSSALTASDESATWSKETCPACPADTGSDYDKAITIFLRDLDREKLSREQHGELLDKFQNLISDLQPGLRNQFLASTFSALADYQHRAGDILERFPNNILLEALQDLNAQRAAIPPFILHMLNQLAPHRFRANGDTAPPRETMAPPAGSDEHFKMVFAEHRAGEYVPDDYQSVLRSLAAPRSAPTLPDEVINELTNSIHDHTPERRLGRILTHLLHTDGDPTDRTGLKNHLSALLQHFIATGDFDAITEIHRGIAGDQRVLTETPRGPMDAMFCGYRFLRDVVQSLRLWPAEKREEIENLIRQVGAPFVPLLMDNLAVEQDRSVRYRYLKLLGEMGEDVRTEAVARLRDGRWHMVRNLVVLLRGLNDPAVMNNLEPLFQHPHERVRQETLKTAYHFRDSRADDALLREFSRSESWPPLWVIGLARHSRDSRVMNRLLNLLNRCGLSKEGFSVSMAIIASLGDLGDPVALGDLERLLFGFSLSHPRRYKDMQQGIVESLKNYPPESTASIYRRLARSIRPDLADLRRMATGATTGVRS